jgi:hypothetical protein
LCQAFTVAQVDENHAAMVAAAMSPAAQSDNLIDMAGVELAAVVGTHGESDVKVSRGGTPPAEG